MIVRFRRSFWRFDGNCNEWSNERALGAPNRVLVERIHVEIDSGGDAVAPGHPARLFDSDD